MTAGGRNLILLGIGAIFVTFLMTGVSLAIYHNSGDIYLDRSRPGFLPDEEELEEEKTVEEDYEFEKTGKITKEILDEYLSNIKKELEAINSYEEPFNVEVLSNERLGIIEER